MDQLTEILKARRESKGWNKSQMARHLGISSQLYGQYEQGQRTPGASFFITWKKVFGDDLTENIETIVSRATVPSSNTGVFPRSETGYLSEYLQSLLEQKRILEEQNQFLRRNFEISLNSIQEAQQIEIAHLKALSWYSAHVQAGENEQETNRELVKINTRVGDFLGATVKKDS